jgi:hypothetical protein
MRPGHTRTAGIIDIDERALVVCDAHDLADRVERQQLVGDRKARQDDECHFRLASDSVLERGHTSSVGKPRTRMIGGTQNRRMAVARRHADNHVARLHQRQMRRHCRAGQPVEHGNIVLVGRASQMF